MPGIWHQASLELLSRNPLLAAALLRGLGVAVPSDATARLAPADLGTSVPVELRADAVVELSERGRGRLVVVVEVQRRWDPDKLYSWPAYLTQARAAHRCPAVLLVICATQATARLCRVPVRTGHPGFDLVPLVIDAATAPPLDAAGMAWAAPELAVLAALTGAIDLSADAGRHQVLAAIAGASLDEETLETYTHFIRALTPKAARDALEALMTTVYKDEFIDRIKAEGRREGQAEGRREGQAEGRREGQAEGRREGQAEGRREGQAEGRREGEAEGAAQMILRVLAARGLRVPAAVRAGVLACSDPDKLAAWGERAATASRIDEVFGTS